MTVEEITEKVIALSRQFGARRLDLFGSFASGTAGERSDLDFTVYGCSDFEGLKDAVDEIPTLRKIDLFNYDEVCSELLKENMDRYGKKIFESVSESEEKS